MPSIILLGRVNFWNTLVPCLDKIKTKGDSLLLEGSGVDLIQQGL